MLGLSAQDLAREDRVLAERWQMLAVFPDDFDRAAAAGVWKVEESAAGLQLSELAARSMVIHDDASRRWRLHDLMRDVAGPLEGQDHSEFEAGLETARARHARHYCGVLEAANKLHISGGEGVLAGLALYDLEQRNIATGQAWAAARIDQDDTAARLAAHYPAAGFEILRLRLHPRQEVSWMEAAVAGYRHHRDRKGEGAALVALGQALVDLGELDSAFKYVQDGLEVSRALNQRRGEQAALGILGRLHLLLRNPRRATEYFEQGLKLSHEIGDWRAAGEHLNSLGNAWAALGEPQQAVEYYEQSLAIAREIGDPSAEGNALYNSAVVLNGLGERAEAVRRAGEALARYEAMGVKDRVEHVRAQLTAWDAADGCS